MIYETLKIKTNEKIELIDITKNIREIIKINNVFNGKTNIFVPHTTAAVTINENADPDVKLDLNIAMNKLFPKNLNIHHSEGNSSAHLMSSLVGVSTVVFIKNGELLLGTWQGIYFWEFDGPRNRYVQIIIEN
jgi:secondary thiamine-phosphate synthase enzyme